MLGIEKVHEYVLKLIDSDKCPQMDENCDEVEQVDITRCLSGKFHFLFVNRTEKKIDLFFS